MFYRIASYYFKFRLDDYKSLPWDYQEHTFEKYLGEIQAKFMLR